jgi:hypothetical protein
MRVRSGWYTSLSAMIASVWFKNPTTENIAEAESLKSRHHLLLLEEIPEPLPPRSLTEVDAVVPAPKIAYHFLVCGKVAG